MALTQAEILRLTELNRSGFNYVLPDGTVIPTVIGGGAAPTVSVKSVLSGGVAAPIPQAILDYGRTMLNGVIPVYNKNDSGVFDLGSSQGQQYSTQASQAVRTAGLKDPNDEFKGFSNPNSNFNYGPDALTPAPGSTPGISTPGAFAAGAPQSGASGPTFIDNTPTGNGLAQAPVGQTAGISSPFTPGGVTQTRIMGDAALISFPEFPGQVWLVDANGKTIRPFKSDMAFNNSFADPNAARAAIHTLPLNELQQGGALNGFQLLNNNYAIQDDGRAPTLGASYAQIAARYGAQVDEESELMASRTLDGFLNLLKSPSTGSGLSATAVDSILNDKDTLGFYINALAYGGYTPEDIFRDIKRKELVGQGRTDLDSVRPISATQNKTQYAATNDYRNASTNPALSTPARLAGIDMEKYDLPVFSLPDDLFKILVPIADPNSAEFKKKLEEVDSQMYDILLQQLTAQTDQQKAVADYNWDELRGKIERDLGITLSNDAIAAWDQIENIYNTSSQTGLTGSGLEAESIDDYLKKVRLTDQRARDASLTDEEHADADYYSKFATPGQIKELIEEDKAKGLPQEEWRATRWGLVPSADIKDQFSFSKLRALYPVDKYPEITDEIINRMVTSVLDENGNYRSNLYQKYMAGNNMTYGGEDTGAGVLDINFSRDQYKAAKVYEKALLEEKNKYAPYTKADSPFLRSTETGTISKGNNVPASALPQYSNISSILAAAAANKGNIIPTVGTGTGNGTGTPGVGTNANAGGGGTFGTSPTPTPTTPPVPSNPPRPITPVSTSNPIYPSLGSLGNTPAFVSGASSTQPSTSPFVSKPAPSQKAPTPLSVTPTPVTPPKLSNVAGTSAKLPSSTSGMSSTPSTASGSAFPGLVSTVKNTASKVWSGIKGLWG